jgi:hypothetical protein
LLLFTTAEFLRLLRFLAAGLILSPLQGWEIILGCFSQGVDLGYCPSALQAFNLCEFVKFASRFLRSVRLFRLRQAPAVASLWRGKPARQWRLKISVNQRRSAVRFFCRPCRGLDFYWATSQGGACFTSLALGYSLSALQAYIGVNS